MGSRPGSLAGELPNSPAGGPHYLLCLRDASILPLTAIKFERLKYCLRRKAKYLPMCLQVLSVCWAFVNTGTIWAPNTCAQPECGLPNTNGFSCEGRWKVTEKPVTFPNSCILAQRGELPPPAASAEGPKNSSVRHRGWGVPPVGTLELDTFSHALPSELRTLQSACQSPKVLVARSCLTLCDPM